MSIRGGEQVGRLTDDADVMPEVCHVNAGDVCTTDHDGTCPGLVESLEE
jgi:hypothetical protein